MKLSNNKWVKAKVVRQRQEPRSYVVKIFSNDKCYIRNARYVRPFPVNNSLSYGSDCSVGLNVRFSPNKPSQTKTPTPSPKLRCSLSPTTQSTGTPINRPSPNSTHTLQPVPHAPSPDTNHTPLDMTTLKRPTITRSCRIIKQPNKLDL